MERGPLSRYGIRPVQVWSKQNLLEFLLGYGLNGVHRATAGGFGEFGRFFLTYSRALQGIITVQEIEQYSRQWADADIDPERRLLLAAIESEVLAQQCLAHDLVYEAIQFHLARLRLLCELTYADGAVPLRELWDGAVAQLHALCAEHISRVREAWAGEKDLLKTWFGDLHMNTYPVQCARIIEIASLAYFTAADDETREQYVGVRCRVRASGARVCPSHQRPLRRLARSCDTPAVGWRARRCRQCAARAGHSLAL